VNINKKILSVMILGLLLNGCADPNESWVNKSLKEDAYAKKPSVQKKVAKYMTMPEKVLCIYYINYYPMLTPKFLKKKAQTARKVAIEKREIDCSKYYDDAYYDKQKRMDDIADATKRALDENAQSKKEAAEMINKRKPTNCTERKSGSRTIITCN
tara:strand:- start:246 stop:713 length:468 start_codon:yes stop_codon:yes gene_type:complete